MRAETLALALGCALAGCQRPDCQPLVADSTASDPLAPAAGYAARTVLTGLVQPTQLQFDRTGRLFVLEGGPDSPKAVRIFSPALAPAGGFALDTPGESTGLWVIGAGERLLVASRGRVDLIDAAPGGGYLPPTPWVVDLPSGPEHTNNGLAVGPDGLVYFGLGSTCDVCDEADARVATVLRADLSQSAPALEVFARGLRNAYDVAFTAQGELLATDNGPECCANTPGCNAAGPDRLVAVHAGDDFGWPDAFRGRRSLPEPLARLPVHGGATGFTIASATGCDDAVYLTLFGSENGTEQGRRVKRATLTRDTAGTLRAGPLEDVLGPSGLVHPIDVTFGPDGALYVLDYGGSVVRVAPSGACP